MLLVRQKSERPRLLSRRSLVLLTPALPCLLGLRNPVQMHNSWNKVALSLFDEANAPCFCHLNLYHNASSIFTLSCTYHCLQSFQTTTPLLTIIWPVSWNWNGSHPSGTAAEVKAGEVTVTSKRGNEISKTGDENNPAVHIERSGNDVVKTANELNVDKKVEGSSSNGNTNGESKQEEKKDEEMKDAEKDDVKDDKQEEVNEGEKKDEAQAGDKRKADEKVDAAEETKEEEEEGDDAKKQKTNNGTNASTANGDKKKPGRPKVGSNGEKKAPKKEKKQPAVGKAQRKTRSQAKADSD